MKMKMKTFVCRVSQRETSTNRKDGAKDRPVFHDQLYEIFYYFFVMSTAAAIWTAAGKPFPFFLFFLISNFALSFGDGRVHRRSVDSLQLGSYRSAFHWLKCAGDFVNAAFSCPQSIVFIALE